jgi:hypothetical protein
MASSSSCLAQQQHPPFLLRCLPFPAPLGCVHKILPWYRRSSRHRGAPISRRDGFLAAYRAGSRGIPIACPCIRLAWELRRTAGLGLRAPRPDGGMEPVTLCEGASRPPPSAASSPTAGLRYGHFLVDCSFPALTA